MANIFVRAGVGGRKPGWDFRSRIACDYSGWSGGMRRLPHCDVVSALVKCHASPALAPLIGCLQ